MARWLDQPLAQVIRFQIPGPDPGFAEAFEDHFGRPYDEEEAEAVYAKVGEGAQLSSCPLALLQYGLTMEVGNSNILQENCGPSWPCWCVQKG